MSTTPSPDRHVHVDLGGFLKGRTVDRAAALTPSPAMIDAGGDAALIGAGIDGADGSSRSRIPMMSTPCSDREARISFEQLLRELRPLAWAP
jgi:hypothetical protein